MLAVASLTISRDQCESTGFQDPESLKKKKLVFFSTSILNDRAFLHQKVTEVTTIRT